MIYARIKAYENKTSIFFYGIEDEGSIDIFEEYETWNDEPEDFLAMKHFIPISETFFYRP